MGASRAPRPEAIFNLGCADGGGEVPSGRIVAAGPPPAGVAGSGGPGAGQPAGMPLTAVTRRVKKLPSASRWVILTGR